MKNIKNLIKINLTTYFFILSFLFTGLIKNILLIYLIVIVHELGHILIIKILKYKILKVEIYPIGGITKVEKKINTPLNQELLIASFGIVFQLILSLIFLLLKEINFFNLSTYNLFIRYNKTIMFFNLLPIIPLDGSIIFRTFLEYCFSFKKAYYINFMISIIFISLFITYNQIFSLNNYLLISFLIYKIYYSFKDFKYEYLRFQLERYLFLLSFKKIKNEKQKDLNLLKKDTYHYFKNNNTFISEKVLLKEKFQNMK